MAILGASFFFENIPEENIENDGWTAIFRTFGFWGAKKSFPKKFVPKNVENS